jgi:coenzyme F420 hydrogenase subunit beta
MTDTVAPPNGSTDPLPVSLPRRKDPKVAEVGDRYRELLASADDPHEWAYAWRTEINRGGFRAVDLLMEEIVETGKCIGCASCVSICPTDVFDYKNELPVDTRADACVYCVLCVEVCPVMRPMDKDIPNLIEFREPKLDEGYGSYSYGMYTRATDPEILENGQDGGMVSAVLLHALENGTLSGAIVGDVLPDNTQVGTHMVATTRKDILSSSASRYTYSPNNLALIDAMRADIKPIALVGVPCQIDGLRLQQNSSIRMEMATWFRKNVTLAIGLFCSEAFTHESIEKLAGLVDVDPDRIVNINIKGKVVIRLDDGEVVNASLKKYGEWARPACLYCLDYSTENADIGAGGIGLDGWTYTLVRTEAGHNAIQSALDDGWLESRPLEDEPRGEWLLNKLAANKKKNRPLPALMPTYEERVALGSLDPKRFYTSGPGAPPKVEEDA